MAIPQKTADEVLAKCARHCCICRRFKPLHLQVHHIIEQVVDGSDEFDNLIAVCLTCHSDVHTQTKLTRRFTVAELKLHRENVYRLIADGKLPATEVPNAIGMATRAAVKSATRNLTGQALGAEAVKLLIAAASGDGDNEGKLNEMKLGGDWFLMVGDATVGIGSNREGARLREGLAQLVTQKLVEKYATASYRVTHHGYLTADELLASGAQNTTSTA